MKSTIVTNHQLAEAYARLTLPLTNELGAKNVNAVKQMVTAAQVNLPDHVSAEGSLDKVEGLRLPDITASVLTDIVLLGEESANRKLQTKNHGSLFLVGNEGEILDVVTFRSANVTNIKGEDYGVMSESAKEINLRQMEEEE